jgi:hypothetical protein
MPGPTKHNPAYTSGWAEVVLARVMRLEAEVDSIDASQPTDCKGDGEGVVSHVRERLVMVRNATRRPGRPRFFAWWRGTEIERAWLNIHAAEVALVDVLPIEVLSGRRAGVLTLLTEALPAGDPRLTSAKAAFADKEWERPKPDQLCHLRSHYAAALGWGYDASDEQHERVRSFRNTVLGAAVALLVLAAALLVVGWRSPAAIPVCNTPPATATPATGQAPAVDQAGAPVTQAICPSGRPSPSSLDLFYVELLGLVGGSLAGAVAIRGLRGTSTPYAVPLVLIALKLPSGALTAVAGILFIRAGFVPGLTSLDNQAQLLAYALLFGYAQQIFTRLIDSQAHVVLDKIPKSEPDSAAKPS